MNGGRDTYCSWQACSQVSAMQSKSKLSAHGDWGFEDVCLVQVRDNPAKLGRVNTGEGKLMEFKYAD